MIKKGLVQIYTGPGKGKTTAAFGLSLRASGDNNKVLIYQFLKPPTLDLSERAAIEKSNLDITVKTLDVEWDMFRSFMDADILRKTREAISRILHELTEKAANREYNLIVLDEIVFCESVNLVALEDIKHLIDNRDTSVEIVMTGRDATQQMIDLADLVSEIQAVKHPYEDGIVARKGIEY